jgi:putative ABC transport system permease protein
MRLEIHDQPRMGFGRTLQLTLHAIRYRLFRSLVTVLVVTVAIAFLMNVVAESLLKREVARRSTRELAAERLAAAWVTRLTAPGTAAELLRELAATEPGAPEAEEARDFGRIPGTRLRALLADARDADAYLRFFESLDYARHRRLAGPARGAAIFDGLASDAEWSRFRAELAALKSLRLPAPPSAPDADPLEAFRAFVGRWPVLRADVEAIGAGREAAILRVADALAGRSVPVALTDAAGAFGDTVRAAGYRLDPALGDALAHQARRFVQAAYLDELVAQPAVRAELAARLDKLPGQINAALFWRLMRSERHAAWFAGRLTERPKPEGDWSAARLGELARARAREEALVRSSRLGEQLGRAGLLGLGERMGWLVLVSMVVCLVGIANAMLMTVTERFREIATLKCLGALDGYIMLTFVLEACMLGVVGGVAGSLLGTLIGTGRMLAEFGAFVWRALPAAALFGAAATAVVAGVILAALAAVYPSLKAARLAPMEAMRIE